MNDRADYAEALTGLFMAAGMKYGYTDPDDLAGKTSQYQLVQDFARRFSDEYRSFLCRDFLPFTVRGLRQLTAAGARPIPRCAIAPGRPADI